MQIDVIGKSVVVRLPNGVSMLGAFISESAAANAAGWLARNHNVGREETDSDTYRRYHNFRQLALSAVNMSKSHHKL
jgi:hypothetical protein